MAALKVMKLDSWRVPRWVEVHVLVRDARAFSCAGSGVDDLRLVHAAGGGVGRLTDSTFGYVLWGSDSIPTALLLTYTTHRRFSVM